MDINIFNNRNIEKEKSVSHTSLISDFINMLTQALNPKKENIYEKYPSDADYIATYTDNNDLKVVNEGDICIVDYSLEERVSFIDTENGKQFDVFYAKDNKTYNKLIRLGIDKNKICRIDEDEFNNIRPWDKYIMDDNQTLQKYEGELDINTVNARCVPDTDIWYHLEQKDRAIKEDEGKRYIISSIENGVIKFKREDLQVTAMEYQSSYPDAKVGDVFIVKDRKYVKENSDN